MRWLKYLLAVLVILAMVGGAWLGLRQVEASFTYGVRAEFEKLPENDKALEDWLTAQPGVVRASCSRDDRAIVVGWVMVQNMDGDPPTPDLRRAFARFGYSGLSNYNGNWVGD